MKCEKSIGLTPIKVTQGELELTEFCITKYDSNQYASLESYYLDGIKPQIARLDYREQPLFITTADAKYFFDAEQETLIKEADGNKVPLGCGKIIVKANYKKATKKLAERIEISVELTADYQKDYEIIPFHKDPSTNQSAIESFMARYISKPFIYLENVVGVELNFNKVFYKPDPLRPVDKIKADIADLDKELKALEVELAL